LPQARSFRPAWSVSRISTVARAMGAARGSIWSRSLRAAAAAERRMAAGSGGEAEGLGSGVWGLGFGAVRRLRSWSGLGRGVIDLRGGVMARFVLMISGSAGEVF